MIRRDCVHYHCEHNMGASIDCCTLRGLGNCPCSNDCNDYANKKEIYLLGLEVFKGRMNKKLYTQEELDHAIEYALKVGDQKGKEYDR